MIKILLATLLLLIIIISCVDLFDNTPQMIDSLDTKNLGYGNILFYKSLSNASVNESIQIRSDIDTNKVLVLFERYDLIVEKRVKNKTLQIVLQDTSGYEVNLDTFHFHLDTLFTVNHPIILPLSITSRKDI